MSANSRNRAPGERQLDFDLHGVIGVRLIDATPREVAAVRAQLGGLTYPLQRDPDIVVRFVPHLPTPGLRYVEMGRSGFTDQGFFILSHRRRPVRVRMPFGFPEEPCEIVCEHGLRSVPLLDAWIKLVAVRKGYAPVHASAFEYQGAGVLVAGWAHGGKTSCLLAHAHTGAAFVSDDLVLLSGDGRTMLGFPTPVSVSDRQLDQLPPMRRRLGWTRRTLLAGARAVERLQPVFGGSRAGGMLHAAVPALRRRLKVSVPPEDLFGPVGSCEAEPRKVFLALSQAATEIRVEPADPDVVAEQLTASLRLELHSWLEQYLAYCFAFPGRESGLPARVPAEATRLLKQALADKEVFTLRHPHPVSLWELRRAMRPHIEGSPEITAGKLRVAR